MPEAKTVSQLMRENPSFLSVLNPQLKDTVSVHVEGVGKIINMIREQNNIIADNRRHGASTEYAAGIRNGLMYALGILKFEEAKWT